MNEQMFYDLVKQGVNSGMTMADIANQIQKAGNKVELEINKAKEAERVERETKKARGNAIADLANRMYAGKTTIDDVVEVMRVYAESKCADAPRAFLHTIFDNEAIGSMMDEMFDAIDALTQLCKLIGVDLSDEAELTKAAEKAKQEMGLKGTAVRPSTVQMPKSRTTTIDLETDNDVINEFLKGLT